MRKHRITKNIGVWAIPRPLTDFVIKLMGLSIKSGKIDPNINQNLCNFSNLNLLNEIISSIMKSGKKTWNKGKI